MSLQLCVKRTQYETKLISLHSDENFLNIYRSVNKFAAIIYESLYSGMLLKATNLNGCGLLFKNHGDPFFFSYRVLLLEKLNLLDYFGISPEPLVNF